MANRLKNIPIKTSPLGKRYRANTLYPNIPLDEEDIYIITNSSDRYDILAQQFYNDHKLWWIIATANKGFKGTLNVPIGIQLRIPANKDQIVNKFEELNT